MRYDRNPWDATDPDGSLYSHTLKSVAEYNIEDSPHETVVDLFNIRKVSCQSQPQQSQPQSQHSQSSSQSNEGIKRGSSKVVG